MKMRLLYLIAVFFIAACASRPELVSRPGGNPAGVDLSGTWVLRESGDVPLAAEQTIVLPRRTSRGPETNGRQPSRQARSKGSAAQVFLETGRTLKISQTPHGLFVSFDRAVVEEFRFGENRLVSVGPIEAQRVSGWVGETLLIETMDEDGYVLSESWRLDAGGSVLLRDVAITRGDTQTLSLQQLFDRD